ncbi:hypothetical protein H0H92_010164 [Tricholoma furcatifolium]|nr:hypothetical protein H0H92_010164 [Tricholoma furcatifolium]
MAKRYALLPDNFRDRPTKRLILHSSGHFGACPQTEATLFETIQAAGSLVCYTTESLSGLKKVLPFIGGYTLLAMIAVHGIRMKGDSLDRALTLVGSDGAVALEYSYDDERMKPLQEWRLRETEYDWSNDGPIAEFMIEGEIVDL